MAHFYVAVKDSTPFSVIKEILESDEPLYIDKSGLLISNMNVPNHSDCAFKAAELYPLFDMDEFSALLS